MADDYIQIISMGDSSGDSEGKYEIYEAGEDMFCVIGLDNNKQTSSKTPVAKPKYKQSYREAWESMRDFKGWLTSVPGNTSKAYCKLCQKELHCHRLSLLKHKVTYKHQKKEEEQKLTKLKGDKSEISSKKTKDVLEDNTVESQITESGYDIEGNDCAVELNETVPQATTSETSNSPAQDIEETPNLELGSLSTHILDISKGVPAASVQVVLYKLIEGRWTLIQEGLTNTEGRYNFFEMNQEEFSIGRYKIHFDVDNYFESQNQKTIFPFIEVVFNVKDITSKYHIPLLLSPFGYSVYRGS